MKRTPQFHKSNVAHKRTRADREMKFPLNPIPSMAKDRKLEKQDVDQIHGLYVI